MKRRGTCRPTGGMLRKRLRVWLRLVGGHIRSSLRCYVLPQAMAVTRGLQRRLRSFGKRLAVRTAALALCMAGVMPGVPERVRSLRIRFLLRCFGWLKQGLLWLDCKGVRILKRSLLQSRRQLLRCSWGRDVPEREKTCRQRCGGPPYGCLHNSNYVNPWR